MFSTRNLPTFILLILTLVLWIFIPPQITHADEEFIKLTASDVAESDRFGWSVAVDGNIVVVGAPHDDDNGRDSGGACVYDCSGLSCTQVDKLIASDATANDWFGYSVAVDENTVVVGAVGRGPGSAYVYDCSSLPCTQVSKLTASNTVAGISLGLAVAIDGNTVVVGTSGGRDTPGTVAYIFDLSTCGMTCAETSKLTPSDMATFDYFGLSVAVDGNMVVIGAPRDDNTGGEDAGLAYIFDLSTCGVTCIGDNKLTASDSAAYDIFGNTVAVDGDIVVVGAPYDDDAGDYSGAAYVYDCSSLPCVENKLTAFDAAAGAWFGWSVAIDGNTVVIDARIDDKVGSAYVYTCDGSPLSCTQVSKLKVSDSKVGSFGESVAVDGNTVVVGAWGTDNGGDNFGAVYVFDIPPAP